jgi:hypothetical protein
MVSGPRVFLGSSVEGRQVAEAFQALIADNSEPTVWNQGIFAAGQYAMPALEREARRSDFAILILTPDDVVQIRGEVLPSPRGNVLLELGFFMGAIGLDRVLMLVPNTPSMALPSDLSGIVQLRYPTGRSDGNLRAALGPAALDARELFSSMGSRQHGVVLGSESVGAERHAHLLARELEMLDCSIVSQGWRRIRQRSVTTLRYQSPKGKRFSLRISPDPAITRADLRDLARELRAHGLRVNDRLRQPA